MAYLDVDAVLLDAGGVFLLPDPQVMAPAMRAAGVEPELATLDRAHYLAVAAMDTAGDDHEVMWDCYRRTYAAACGVPAEQVEAVAAALATSFDADSWTRVVPGAVEALRRIAAAGPALAIVSNSAGSIAEMLLAAEVCQVGEGRGVPVAIVVDSHRVGVEKPDPRIFEVALRELGVAPERAVYAGDTIRFDVAGSRAAGIRPLHVDPYGSCPRPLDSHDHLRSLAELPGLLGAAGAGGAPPTPPG